jgi:hypothetical protein
MAALMDSSARGRWRCLVMGSGHPIRAARQRWLRGDPGIQADVQHPATTGVARDPSVGVFG